MRLRDIGIVAVYEAKQQSRQWVFRFFVLFSLIGITFCHVVLQGYDNCKDWKMVALACSIPLVNAYLFSVVQSLFVIILMTDIPSREGREGALECIHARPLGNGEYTIGRVLGNMLLFVVVNWMIMLACMLFVNASSMAPFSFKYYLFYFLTINIPSFIFMSGLSLWLVRLLRVRYLVLVLLFFLLIASVVWLPYCFYGTFDFLGSGLPNLFSDTMGHVGLGNYLLHRSLYLFIGLGLVACSVHRMKRLPNSDRQLKYYSLAGVVLVLVGLSFGGVLETRYRSVREARAAYRNDFQQYWKKLGCRVAAHNIRVEQSGEKLILASDLVLYNPNGEIVREPLLFLNPGLEITSLTSGGKSLPYRRAGQVVVLEQSLAGGDSLHLNLKYEGKIDERYTDLQVSDEAFVSGYREGSSFFPAGRRSAFVGDEFLLLTPACAWYPVAISPVHPFAPLYGDCDLTRFRLKIVAPRQRMLFAQGVASRRGDTTFFCPSKPLSGISLCGGDFELRKVETSDLRVLVYMFKGHAALMNNLRDVKSTSIRKFFTGYLYPKMGFKLSTMNWYEEKTKNLFFIETPLAFRVEANPGKMLSGQVEPGMVFLPERGFGMNLVNALKKDRLNHEESDVFVGARVVGKIDNGVGKCIRVITPVSYLVEGNYSSHPLLGFFTSGEASGNPCYAMPLFHESGLWIHSVDYPFVGTLFLQLLQEREELGYMTYGEMDNDRYRKVFDYFAGRSLKDLFSEGGKDILLFRDALTWKKKDLLARLTQGISKDVFFDALDSVYNCRQGVISLSEFSRELQERVGCDVEKVLAEWFTTTHRQYYKVKDLNVYFYPDDEPYGEGWFEAEGKIMNRGKEGGVVTMEAAENGEVRHYTCYIEPGEAKSFYMTYRGRRNFFYASLNTGLSANRPLAFRLQDVKMAFPAEGFTQKEASWTDLDTSALKPDPGVVIVDNDDVGFSFTEEKRTWLQRWFGGKTQTRYSMTFGKTHRWIPVIDQVYGDSVRSCLCKSSGTGKYTASWTVSLPEGGRYRLMTMVARYNVMGGNQKPLERIVYHYTVKQGDREDNVDVSLDEQLDEGDLMGWVSLGVFDFSAGEVRVTLSDRDDEGRDNIAIMADAMKWVKIE